MSMHTDWVDELTIAMEVALGSMTAVAHGLPDLDKEDYFKLARGAEANTRSAIRFQDYNIVFLPIPSDAVTLLTRHPEIKKILSNCSESGEYALNGLRSGSMAASKTLPIELISRLVRNAARVGMRKSVEDLSKILAQSSGITLPGFEATIVVGMRLHERWDIIDGIYAIPYRDFETQFDILARSYYSQIPNQIMAHGKSVGVLIREFKWGPALDFEFSLPMRTYVCDLEFGIVLDLVRASAGHTFPVVGQCDRAERWVYEIIGPGFDIGGRPFRPFRVDEIIESVDFYHEKREIVELTIKHWQEMNGMNKKKITLAISRLGSAVSRRGLLAEQDRILDVSIALEILYGLEGSELMYKLATRAAWYLGEDEDEMRKIADGMKKLYGVRSRIIHGGDGKGSEERFSYAYEVARKTLLKHLTRKGIPSTKNWEDVVLGVAET